MVISSEASFVKRIKEIANFTMSDIDRRDQYTLEKATAQEVDLVPDPDAHLTEEEKKEVVCHTLKTEYQV